MSDNVCIGYAADGGGRSGAAVRTLFVRAGRADAAKADCAAARMNRTQMGRALSGESRDDSLHACVRFDFRPCCNARV